jgi:hypothetical protein
MKNTIKVRLKANVDILTTIGAHSQKVGSSFQNSLTEWGTYFSMVVKITTFALSLYNSFPTVPRLKQLDR